MDHGFEANDGEGDFARNESLGAVESPLITPARLLDIIEFRQKTVLRFVNQFFSDPLFSQDLRDRLADALTLENECIKNGRYPEGTIRNTFARLLLVFCLMVLLN